MERGGAHLSCGPLEAFARCDGGLSLSLKSWGKAPIPKSAVLASAGPADSSEALEITERYVRGLDFVASYKATGAKHITPHVYWRSNFNESENTVRVELVLSAQTDLLDSGASWIVGSSISNALLLHAASLKRPTFEDASAAAERFDETDAAEHLFVFRASSLGFSYAQMVHPTDFVVAEVAFNEERKLMLRSTLFPERLEKGVIRRGRVCGWFMPVENDLETAVRLARAFVEDPLPLTA
jgi:hypothetical protein